MNDLIERMAKAVYLHHRGRKILPPWEAMDWSDQQFWREAVAAGLKAIREPTGEMVEMGARTIFRENGGLEYAPYVGWQAMVDALVSTSHARRMIPNAADEPHTFGGT
jgi:hypothetical protein